MKPSVMESSRERGCSEKKQLRLSGIQRQPLFSGLQSEVMTKPELVSITVAAYLLQHSTSSHFHYSQSLLDTNF